MNLYFKEGNATAEAELSTLGMADGSVTLGQLAPDALAKIGLDHNPAMAEGSLLAVPHGEQPPPGYASANAQTETVVWYGRIGPVNVGRITFDGVGVLRDQIYFVGGSSGDGHGKIGHKYNPISNEWSDLPDMSTAREGVAVATRGDSLYAIGGYNGSVQSSVEIFDAVSGSWSTGTELPTATSHASAIYFDERIYFIGGKINDDGFRETSTVYEYNFESDLWSVKSSMPTPRHGHELLIFDNKIWVLGGYRGDLDSHLNVVEIYDPSTDSWSSGPSLFSETSWPSVFSNGNKIFVAIGTELKTLNLETEEWGNTSVLPQNSVEGKGVVVNGHSYIITRSGAVISADITPPMDLYYREAIASGTITLEKLSTGLASDFASSTAVSALWGLVSAVDYNDDAPSEHTILERTDRNATHEWGEMA